MNDDILRNYVLNVKKLCRDIKVISNLIDGDVYLSDVGVEFDMTYVLKRIERTKEFEKQMNDRWTIGTRHFVRVNDRDTRFRSQKTMNDRDTPFRSQRQ